MAVWKLYVPTVTQAMRGRDMLSGAGIHAYISRNTDISAGVGCGYVIAVHGDGIAAERILRQKGIKITRKSEGR